MAFNLSDRMRQQATRERARQAHEERVAQRDAHREAQQERARARYDQYMEQRESGETAPRRAADQVRETSLRSLGGDFGEGRRELSRELEREAMRAGIASVRRGEDLMHQFDIMRHQGPLGEGFGQIGEGTFDFDPSGRLQQQSDFGLDVGRDRFARALAGYDTTRRGMALGAGQLGQALPEDFQQRLATQQMMGLGMSPAGAGDAAAMRALGGGMQQGFAERLGQAAGAPGAASGFSAALGGMGRGAGMDDAVAMQLRGMGGGPGQAGSFAQALQQRIAQGLSADRTADAAAQRMLGMAERPMESQADLQFQKNLERSIASQAAAAASAQGLSPAQAARLAQRGEEQARTAAVADSAMLRAQEENAEFARQMHALRGAGQLLQAGDTLGAGLAQAGRAQDIQALQAAGGLADTAQARQLQALQAAGGLSAGAQGRRLQALQAGGGLASADRAQMLDALRAGGAMAGDVQGRQLQALGQAGALDLQGRGQQLDAFRGAGALAGQGRGQSLAQRQAFFDALSGMGRQDLGMAQLGLQGMGMGQDFAMALQDRMLGARMAEEQARQNFFNRALGIQQQPIGVGAGVAGNRTAAWDSRNMSGSQIGQMIGGGLLSAGGAAIGGILSRPDAPVPV